MVMVGLSSASSYVITTSGLPQQLVSFFSSITNSPVVILLLLNILFLIIGMLMEANAAVVMMTPILLPLLNAFGIDLLQFGIVMSFNLCIGLVTPPVGLCLLLCNQTGETRLSHSLKAMMPMLLISIIVLFLITYVSPLTTLLPSIMAGLIAKKGSLGYAKNRIFGNGRHGTAYGEKRGAEVRAARAGLRCGPAADGRLPGGRRHPRQ